MPGTVKDTLTWTSSEDDISGLVQAITEQVIQWSLQVGPPSNQEHNAQ